MKIIIVGGVAGGASTAARLRRLDEKNEIIILERGKEISYANCGIPYHIGNVIKDRKQLIVISKEDFENQFNVKVRTLSEAVSIDRKSKTVKIKDLKNNNVYPENYDKLGLSPGGNPVKPDIPGIDDSAIFTIRNLQDMDLIKQFIGENNPKRAVIIGAGFIGLEIAENLAGLGIMVSIVEVSSQVMNILDFEMAAAIHQHLKAKKVELFLEDAVKEFKKTGGKLTAILTSGHTINTDFVILSIGVKPEISLAKEAGIEIGALGGIKVNENLRTSDEDIFALGDAAETIDSVSGLNALVPLANSANKQGRIVAGNICGANEAYRGTPATAIAKVFDITVAITGNNEKQLKKRKIKYDKCFLSPSSHAGYYPDAFPMMLKLLFEPDGGRILGAQIIGADGIDKRIDVIAALAQMHKTVFDLAALELAYAPPYSSAKDPANIAGMIAVNQIQGRNPAVHWNEVDGLLKEGILFVDVRSPLEYELGHISGAVNIPLAQIRERISEIPKDKKVVVYCNQGKTAYFALSVLKNLGHKKIFNLSGGFKLYKTTKMGQSNVGIFDGFFVDKTEDIRNVLPGKGTILSIDACGLQCPGPIMALAGKMKELKEGDILVITATDPGFKNDVGTWCERTNNLLVAVEEKDAKITARIQKGGIRPETAGAVPHDKTIVVFSSDMDRAIAAFVIANGGAAMGRKVTMFFTFWGLNILRKPKKARLKKGLFDKAFEIMMPRGSKKLSLSQMNMFGLGPKLIRHIMKKKNIESLEGFITAAMNAGVKIVACQMTMDMMGLKKEELIDGVEIGGVANYLGYAENADTNLFI